MRRRIAGSEAHHRERGLGIVAELKVRRRPRRSWLDRIGELWSSLLSLYLGKPE